MEFTLRTHAIGEGDDETRMLHYAPTSFGRNERGATTERPPLTLGYIGMELCMPYEWGMSHLLSELRIAIRLVVVHIFPGVYHRSIGTSRQTLEFANIRGKYCKDDDEAEDDDDAL